MLNRPFRLGVLVWGVLCCACFSGAVGAAGVAEAVFQTRDTPISRKAQTPETQAVLDRVSWDYAEFEVRCTATPGLKYDALVRFDSPIPSGNRWVDRVVMRWYAARGQDGEAIEAPAVLMIHTLQPQMLISDQLAQAFAKRGLHTFVLQLPGYGERWEGRGVFPVVTTLVHGRQAVTDCLRARDAIRALPNIKPGPIALQGTSLGGFVAATVGGIEPSFDPVLLLISGGDCYGALKTGEHDAKFLFQELIREGYAGLKLRHMLESVEPLRVAHRLDPERTWLVTARDDVTIPRSSSDALAEAIGLDDEHRLWLATNHYTTLVVLPGVAEGMADIILGDRGDRADTGEADQ